MIGENRGRGFTFTAKVWEFTPDSLVVKPTLPGYLSIMCNIHPIHIGNMGKFTVQIKDDTNIVDSEGNRVSFLDIPFGAKIKITHSGTIIFKFTPALITDASLIQADKTVRIIRIEEEELITGPHIEPAFPRNGGNNHNLTKLHIPYPIDFGYPFIARVLETNHSTLFVEVIDKHNEEYHRGKFCVVLDEHASIRGRSKPRVLDIKGNLISLTDILPGTLVEITLVGIVSANAGLIPCMIDARASLIQIIGMH